MTPFAHLVFTTCYACYAVALALEIFRLTQRGDFKLRVANWQMLPAIIGFICHTFIIYQQHIVAEQPLGGAAMLFFASAWGLILIYCVWVCRYPNIPFGLIVLPLAMLLLGSGYYWASTVETTGLSLQSFAKMLHIVSAAGFVIAISVLIICRILYLLEVRLLRKKRSLTPPIKLPSLEWSRTVSRISLIIAICCLGLCALGGIVNLLF